jgi:photosystem II stability/assembly factor-like uncharacterized protein
MKNSVIITLIMVVIIFSISILINHNSVPKIDKTSLQFAKKNPTLLKAYELRQKISNPKGKQPDRPDQAMQYEADLRSEIGKAFSYSIDWRIKALKEAKQISLSKQLADNMVWVERGPGNIGGRSRAIVLHPNDTNIWWVGAVGGGIWKTTDAGYSWICQTDDMPVLSATTIDICQSQPNILYAGTGEGFYNYDAVIGDGIFKTENGGSNWTQLVSTAKNVNFRYVNRIIVHPTNASIVLAATNEGLFRSTNGGDSWITIFSDSGRVQQIIANPANFNTQYLTINSKGIYKSTNMGLTWKRVSEEIENHARIEIAISSADTSYLYASAVNSEGGLSGFYKSINAGKDWNFLDDDPNWFRNQGWYDNTLCVDPFNPDIVIVGGIDILKINTVSDTINATALSQWYGGFGLPYVHADQHFLVTIKGLGDNYSIIAANDGGIHYSPDKGISWEDKNNNYNVTQYYDGDRHPFLDKFIAGSQDNGTNLSPSGTIFSTGWNEVIGGDGFDCAWDKENPNVVYGTLYSSTLYKSINGGLTFTLINDDVLEPDDSFFHTPLEMDPHNSQKLFTASGSNLIYYSDDAGENWNSVPVELGSNKILKIRVSKADSNIVWVASTSEYINLSTDAGHTFTPIARPTETPNARLTGLETHPFDSATALIAFGIYGYGKIFRTENLGSTWEDITNNLPDVPVHCALIMPYNTDEIWIGTDIGVFISTNNGQSWSYSTNGLPAVSVRRLKIVNQEIVAVTHGRGIWSMNNDLLPEYVIPLDTPILADLNYPNPNLDQLKVSFIARGNYDSLSIQLNDATVRTMTQFPVYEDTFAYIPVTAPAKLNIRLVGRKDGSYFESDIQSINYYNKVNTLNENFDSEPILFSGDLEISQEAGFASATMHTNHNYDDQRDYITIIETPVKLFDDSKLTYRDVALVEPGEKDAYYPNEQIWDYVTVEGSKNGSDWILLIEPYDCRLNSAWQTAYDTSIPGNSTMFVDHEINLADYFSAGQIVYLRFRLHADEALNGWGWAVDDVKIISEQSTLVDDNSNIATDFNLIGNYPNPFNSGTTIQFSLKQGGLVQLEIFNNLGQKVKTIINNTEYSEGIIHKVRWDGTTVSGSVAASGTYYYRLISGNQSQVKKMILLR